MTEECKEHIPKHHEEKCKDACCDWAGKFLNLADEAWKELLKEKIKAEIERLDGQHIAKLAEMLANANKEKWETKINAKMKYKNYEDSLKEFLTSCNK